MSWWKRLKLWQKAGILVGVMHIFAYFFLVIIFRIPYLDLFIEYPWLYLLMILGMRSPGNLLIFPLGFLIGTAFYALIGTFFGALCGWVVSLVKTK